MATIQSQLVLTDGMSSVLRRMNSALLTCIDSFEQMQSTSSNQIDTTVLRETRASLTELNSELNTSVESQESVSEAASQTDAVVKKLRESFLKLAAAAGLAFSAKELMDLGDTYTETQARLNLITGDLEKTKSLQDAIMDSANRSRAAYQSTADAVSKMGLMAKDAFSSIDENGHKTLNTSELVAFTELLNKQFVIAGTSAQGMDAAMTQLTQAMASGVLRGDELNSIFEQAPTIIETIANHLGVEVGQIRQLAQEGKITADVVKSAMLSSADAINERFNSMPYTYSQVATMISNILYETFQPAIQMIGQGAQFIVDNWDDIEPILVGIAGGVAIATVAWGAWTAAMWLADAANRATIAGMLANPFLWIAVAIGAVVAVAYRFIQAVGGMKNAWTLTQMAIGVGIQALRVGFFTGVYAIMDLGGKLSMAWQKTGAAIANHLGQMRVNVLTTIQNMVNGAIGMINGFINALNKIPGVSIEAISQVTFASTAQAELNAEKSARAKDIATAQADVDAAKRERTWELMRMKGDLDSKASELRGKYSQFKAEKIAMSNGDGIDSLGFEAGTFDTGAGAGVADNIGKTAGNTAAAAGSLAETKENLEYLRDIAEQEAINRFTTAEIKVDYSGMTNQISSNMDLDNVLDALTVKFVEAVQMGAEGVHS
nr:MAG TPA: Tail tape measure [Caudoviricetes sp.]